MQKNIDPASLAASFAASLFIVGYLCTQIYFSQIAHLGLPFFRADYILVGLLFLSYAVTIFIFVFRVSLVGLDEIKNRSYLPFSEGELYLDTERAAVKYVSFYSFLVYRSFFASTLLSLLLFEHGRYLSWCFLPLVIAEISLGIIFPRLKWAYSTKCDISIFICLGSVLIFWSALSYTADKTESAELLYLFFKIIIYAILLQAIARGITALTPVDLSGIFSASFVFFLIAISIPVLISFSSESLKKVRSELNPFTSKSVKAIFISPQTIEGIGTVEKIDGRLLFSDQDFMYFQIYDRTFAVRRDAIQSFSPYKTVNDPPEHQNAEAEAP